MIQSKLERLGSRERIFLGVMAVVLLALLADFLVVKRVLADFHRLAAERENLDRQYGYDMNVLVWEPDVKREYASLEGRLEKVVSRAQSIDDMKGEIDELAGKAGVLLESSDHREPISRGAYEEYFVDIKRFSGSMPALLRFLHSIETAPGLLRVVRLSIQQRKDEGMFEGSMLISKAMRIPAENDA